MCPSCRKLLVLVGVLATLLLLAILFVFLKRPELLQPQEKLQLLRTTLRLQTDKLKLLDTIRELTTGELRAAMKDTALIKRSMTPEAERAPGATISRLRERLVESGEDRAALVDKALERIKRIQAEK